MYRSKPVFLYGQLYIAISKATIKSNIRTLVVPAVEKDVNQEKRKKKLTMSIFTKNIIYKEVLTQ